MSSNRANSGRYGREEYDCDRRRQRSRSRGRQPVQRQGRYRAPDDSFRRSHSRSYSPERRRQRRRSSRSRSRSDSRGRSARGFGGSRRHYNQAGRHRDERNSRSRSHSNPRSLHQRPAAQRGREPPHAGAVGARSSEERHAGGDDSSSSDGSMNLANLPLPKREADVASYYALDGGEPIDKERIHREMEEKLRATLAAEGKVYPPPKAEAAHPVFANDGSFIEIFKKMQEAQKQQHAGAPMLMAAAAAPVLPAAAASSSAAATAAPSTSKAAPPPPLVGRRRGGKILKTGVVAKPKAITDPNVDPKDFWSLYLAEVNKYKSHACESEGGTRPLVK